MTGAGQRLDNAGWVRFANLGGQLAGLRPDDWLDLADRVDKLKVKVVELGLAV